MSEFITIIRPEFMRICKDACRAAALNHLLFRIAYKCKDQPKEKIQAGDITWYAKTEQITEEMSNAWGVCKVRKEVNALISTGLVERKSNPQWGADRTKHFSFGKEQCHKFLELCQEQNICMVHLDLPTEVKHLIYISNGNDTSIKCICSIHQMEAINVSDANDISIEAIPKKTTKIDYKDNSKEESTDASANAPAAPTPFAQQQQQAEHIHIASSKQEARVSEQEDIPPDENNAHSHGEVTQANSVGVVPHGRAKEIPPEEQKTPPRPRRTPPVHKDGVPTAERIEQVFVCMEGTIRRLTEQEDFTFGRTKKAKEAIKDLLQGRTVSQEKMDWHIVRLWHKPKDAKSGFWWRENMSVVAICNNYDREIVNYKPGAPGGASTTTDKPRPTALVSEEQARKNIDKMRQRVAAMQAAAAAK